MKNQTRCEVYSFKCGAAAQRQCHLTTLTPPVADKSGATGSSSSRGKKKSICFIFTKPYSLATSVSVLSKEKKKQQTNQPAPFFFFPPHHANLDSASEMLPLTPLVLGALRSVSDGVGWGCLDKSLSQNGVEMEHALVMMWNLMFAFCPAGKRGFGLVIFFFFPVIFFSFFLWHGCQRGNERTRPQKRAPGLKI